MGANVGELGRSRNRVGPVPDGRKVGKMEEPYPETVLPGSPTKGDLDVECDYCSRPAITMGDGMKLCARHSNETKPANEYI